MSLGSTFQSVQLFLPAGADDAWSELAERYAEGFASLGLGVQTQVAELPQSRWPANELALVIAPHAYAQLQAKRFSIPWRTRQQLRNAFLVNVAPPSTAAFAATRELVPYARGVFDCHPDSLEAWRSSGIEALAAPLGWPTHRTPSDCLPAPETAPPLDVLLWGASGPRRERFVAKHADALSAWNYEVHLSPAFAVPGPHGPFANPTRRLDELLNRARVVISVQDDNDTPVAWDLALRATACNCLFVGERAPDRSPLFPAPLDVGDTAKNLWPLAEHFLRHESERRALVDRRRSWLRDERSTMTICAEMLRFAQATSPPRPSTRQTLRHALVDWTKAVTITCDAKRRRLVDKLSRPWLALRQGWRRDRLVTIRRDQIERLAASQRRRAEGISDCETLSNFDNAGETPTLAVIVSLYNYSSYIRACLDSLAASDLRELPGGAEVLVVDDASTDDSAAVVANYLRSSPLRLRLLRKQLNTGLADTRNVGLAATRAPYVFTLDADNLVAPCCFRPLYDAIRSTRAAATYGLIVKFEHASGAGVGLLSQCAWDESTLVQAPYIDAMALFDRQQLWNVGGYSTELLRHGWNGWEDYDLWLKLAAQGERAVMLPRIVARYRVHSSSMINSTALFSEPLARYFYERFRGLLDLASHAPLRFGLPYRPRWERAAAALIGAERGEEPAAQRRPLRDPPFPTNPLSAVSPP